MIEESKIYTIVCDNCRTKYIGMSNIDLLEEVAQDEEWIKVNKEHYCPECYTIDEHDDVQIKLL